jgi:diguanylate cyclase (GGDEF)-like protein
MGNRGAVLLVDLDEFKVVNDTFGHLIGDRLLMAVARRLEQVTRSTDTICRFGGDEFLYLAESVSSEIEADHMAVRLLDSLREPFIIDGVHVEQRASVGVVVWDETSLGYNEIVHEADLALYEAKREGKGHHVVFTPGMHAESVNRFALINDLRHALSANQITMNLPAHHRPEDHQGHWLRGVDALAAPRTRAGRARRLHSPGRTERPDTRTRGFALHEAVGAASRWPLLDDDGPAPYVTVNLSAHQFRDPQLAKMIEAELRESKLPPDRLIIEITESVTLLYVAETLSVMEELNAMGVGFALDDFGTGYSSLSYLALTHPKIIKIDQTFVSPAVESLRNDALLGGHRHARPEARHDHARRGHRNGIAA